MAVNAECYFVDPFIFNFLHRLLSLSVEGKLTEMLRALAQAASQYAAALGLSMEEWDDRDTAYENTVQWQVQQRRKHPVRTLVREMVVQYPHILGTAMHRVSERFAFAVEAEADWGAYITILRRSEAAHVNWLAARDRAERLTPVVLIDDTATAAVHAIKVSDTDDAAGFQDQNQQQKRKQKHSSSPSQKSNSSKLRSSTRRSFTASDMQAQLGALSVLTAVNQHALPQLVEFLLSPPIYHSQKIIFPLSRFSSSAESNNNNINSAPPRTLHQQRPLFDEQSRASGGNPRKLLNLLLPRSCQLQQQLQTNNREAAISAPPSHEHQQPLLPALPSEITVFPIYKKARDKRKFQK